MKWEKGDFVYLVQKHVSRIPDPYAMIVKLKLKRKVIPEVYVEHVSRRIGRYEEIEDIVKEIREAGARALDDRDKTVRWEAEVHGVIPRDAMDVIKRAGEMKQRIFEDNPDIYSSLDGAKRVVLSFLKTTRMRVEDLEGAFRSQDI